MIFNSDPLPLVYHVLYKGNKEDVKGTMIEKYYDDFQHVRLVPFKIVAKKTGIESERFFGEDIYRFTQKLSHGEKPTTEFTSYGGGGDHINDKYRRIMKMQWLINDLETVGCKEPIHVNIQMNIFPRRTWTPNGQN